jgi:hypothetical protein
MHPGRFGGLSIEHDNTHIAGVRSHHHTLVTTQTCLLTAIHSSRTFILFRTHSSPPSPLYLIWTSPDHYFMRAAVLTSLTSPQGASMVRSRPQRRRGTTTKDRGPSHALRQGFCSAIMHPTWPNTVLPLFHPLILPCGQSTTLAEASCGSVTQLPFHWSPVTRLYSHHPWPGLQLGLSWPVS